MSKTPQYRTFARTNSPDRRLFRTFEKNSLNDERNRLTSCCLHLKKKNKIQKGNLNFTLFICFFFFDKNQ